MGTVGELDVVPGEAGQLAEPESGLHAEGDEGVIAPPLPTAKVRCSEERIDLIGLQERHLRLVRALLGDGEHLGDELGVFGVTQLSEAEQRPEGRQAGVAAPGAVAAVGLEVVEERCYGPGVEVIPVHAVACRCGSVRSAWSGLGTGPRLR